MNCIIVEDQPPAQRILRKYIEDVETLELKATFSNALEAMDFLKTESVELIFLDIHLPKLSGMDFLKSLVHPPNVILTTAFPDYALESYEFDVVDYLLKPFSFQRFVKAVAKVPNEKGSIDNPKETAPHSPPKAFFIKSGYEHIKVHTDDILYIQSDADYTEIVLPKKKHLSSESLKYWLDTLSASQFVRIHKSYIINASKIEKIAGNQVFLEQGPVIPIGRAYKDDFLNKFL